MYSSMQEDYSTKSVLVSEAYLLLDLGLYEPVLRIDRRENYGCITFGELRNGIGESDNLE